MYSITYYAMLRTLYNVTIQYSFLFSSLVISVILFHHFYSFVFFIFLFVVW